MVGSSIFWGVQLCKLQSLDYQNTLIVQSILQIKSIDTLSLSLSSMLNLSFLTGPDDIMNAHDQSRIWVTPRYFSIKWMRPTWPGQNMTQITLITHMNQPSFNPVHSNHNWLWASYLALCINDRKWVIKVLGCLFLIHFTMWCV